MPSSSDSSAVAGLIPRGLAYLIDYAVAFVLFASTQLLLIAPFKDILGLGGDWLYSGWNMEIYTLVTISLPIWLYFALLEASPWQATVGKRLMKLKVETDAGGGRIGVIRSLSRTVVKLLPWELAHVTNNFPEPMWYAEDPGFRLGFIFVGVLMGIYLTTVLLSRQHQAPHDLATRTVVVVDDRYSASSG